MKSLSKGTRIGKEKKNFTFHSTHKPDNIVAKGEEGKKFLFLFHDLIFTKNLRRIQGLRLELKRE
jgi:alkyl hydroperoxide reductase subunit AhpC